MLNFNLNIKKGLIILSLPLLLNACTTNLSLNQEGLTGIYGQINLIEASASIAQDCADFLSAKFAPATTQFNFKYQNTDVFGSDFRIELRKKGFKVSELNEFETSAKKINYIIDSSNNEWIRVVIFIDDQTYSRFYSIQDAKPLSVWTEKQV